MRTRFLAYAVVGSLVGGCSHIPDPADVPGVEPYNILQNIRCEIAAVLITDYPKGHPKHKWVRESDIAYGLQLFAEEERNTSANLTMLWPIHLGTFTLGLSAGKERTRSGENLVNFAEELKNPLALVKAPLPTDAHGHVIEPLPCAAPLHALAYPILGSVGMRDVIRRFVEINSIASDGGELNGVALPKGYATDVFLYTLKFHLKFKGGVKPSFKIERLDGRTISGDADLNGARWDKHELVIALGPPSKQELAVAPGKFRATGVPRAIRQERLLDQVREKQLRGLFREDIREELRGIQR
jgi:hypothetical protein